MPRVIIIAQGIEIRDAGQGYWLQHFLKAQCDPQGGGVWTYPKGPKAKATHKVMVVYDMAAFTKALDTADTFVVYEGHSRYGQGPAFGPANTPKVPDKKAFPTNPWGVHYRMGYDATDTEAMDDLIDHSVVPGEYDLVAAGAKAFLPTALENASAKAKARAKHIKAKKVKAKAVCGLSGAWRSFSSCAPALATTKTARGDEPLKGRHYYARLVKKPRDEFMVSVGVGSADLDKSNLRCKVLFMASCSSKVHFYRPLARRRRAVKSTCKFILTGQVCATSHGKHFLEQVLVKGHDPTTKAWMTKIVKALNGVVDAGLVGDY
jgi:hypothetical protein